MEKLRDMDFEELAGVINSLGHDAYRAEQVFRWAHSGAGSYDEMTNIPKTLRAELGSRFSITAPAMVRKLVSRDNTIKYLWGFEDGNCVETVLMSYEHGYSVCVSTQVGCRMDCGFCASGKGGLVRNLSAGEILEQALFAARDAGARVSNIVLMGTGEPLDNFDNVIKFIHLANDSRSLGVGQRHISLSTCGLCDKIEKLQKLDLQITLSVSLHAPNDALRRQIMPITRRWSVAELMRTCRTYAEATGRRISYEYVLIKGFNDLPVCAEELAALLRGTLCHVNLIRLNRIEESEYGPSDIEDAKRFVEILSKNGINATVRRRLGQDIDASCGQLRQKCERDKG